MQMLSSSSKRSLAISYCWIWVIHALYSQQNLPIVYVYTVVPRVCQQGLPLYIKISLEQAIMSQPDCDIVLARLIKQLHFYIRIECMFLQ